MVHTIQSDDFPKIDLGVEEGLDGGGDIVRVIMVLSVAAATVVMVMVMA